MQRISYKSIQKNEVEIIIKRILPENINIRFFKNSSGEKLARPTVLRVELIHKLRANFSRFDFQDDRHFFHIDGNVNFDKRLVSA